MATLEIPKDVLDPIINAHVTKALTEAFGNGGAILQDVVRKVLTTKVDSRGEPDRYNSRDAMPTIEWMAREALKEAAREAVKQALVEHKDLMKAAIVRELTRSQSKMLRELASTLVEGVAKAAANGYRLTVAIKDNDR